MSSGISVFEPLRDFEERLPLKPYYGFSKRIEGIKSKDEAISFPYIQVNFPRIDYLCFDCDFKDAVLRPGLMDIPNPTLSIANRESGNAHLLYEILDPIPYKQSQKTRKLLQDVVFGLKEILCADKCITTQKQLVKNALSNEWGVIQGYTPFSLSELVEYIPDGVKRKRSFEAPTGPVAVKPFEDTLELHSRNCSIFENARLYAYTIVHEHSSYESLYEAVFEYVEHLNDVEVVKYFPAKIKLVSELKSIARSIARWTVKHRGQLRQLDAGAMGLPSMKGRCWQREEYDAEVARRRKLSAERTNRMRREDTRQRILDAVALCRKRGFQITVENILIISGLGRRTVYNYLGFIEEINR